MDYKEYKGLYQQLLSQQGREALERDPQNKQIMEKKINEFLEKYPAVVPADKRQDTPFHLLSIKEVFHRSMLVAIDVINDISSAVTNFEVDGATVTRRRIFAAFAQEERRMYIGVWLIFLAFVFFFIDGSS